MKQCSNVSELITMVNEEQNLSNIEITTDTIYLFTDTLYLENLEIWNRQKFRQYTKKDTAKQK